MTVALTRPQDSDKWGHPSVSLINPEGLNPFSAGPSMTELEPKGEMPVPLCEPVLLGLGGGQGTPGC